MRTLTAEILQWHLRSTGLPWHTITITTIDKDLNMVMVQWNHETGEVNTVMSHEVKPRTVVLAA